MNTCHGWMFVLFRETLCTSCCLGTMPVALWFWEQNLSTHVIENLNRNGMGSLREKF